MLSMILSHANSNETSFAGLQHIAVVQLRVRPGLLSVDTYAALLDQPACIAAAFGKSRLEKGCDEITGIVRLKVGNLFGNLTFAELRLEVGLGAPRCLLPVES